MTKPWTKKAHEKKALKEKKKDRTIVKKTQVPEFSVDEFVGSLKNLLKALGKENENVLVIDLKRSKVVYGTFPSENIDKTVFDVYNYNGNLASLEGAELLRYIFRYTKSFFGKLFVGMNSDPKTGFIEIKAGNKVIRRWEGLEDLKLNPYGANKYLEDIFGDLNNRDQIILISTTTKTRKILRKIFEKISPYSDSRTALDAKVVDNCEDYLLDRFYSLSYFGKENIYLKENPRFVKKCRIEDKLDLIDKEFLGDEARFATTCFLERCGFTNAEMSRLCNKPINLKEAHDYILNYLANNPKPDYTELKGGDYYYDYNLIVTAFIEYLKSTL